ncbi:MAG: hypothetical protein ACI9FB_003476 [Candidatus Azotimanducaceae bacterium]|jgi:hypothetical protein
MVVILIWAIKDQRIYRTENALSICFLISVVLVGVLFRFDFSLDGRWLSFVCWSIVAVMSVFKIRWVDFKIASNFVIAVHIMIASVDMVAFSLVDMDLSFFLLDLESRHITNAKPYVRATGLMGEPGTLAAMLYRN